MQMCQLSLVNKTVIKHATNASNYKAAQNIQRRPGDCWKPWDAWGPSEKPEMEEEFHWWCIHSGQAIKSENFNEWHHVSIASANSKSPHLLVNIQGTSSESLSEATSKTPPGQSFLVHIHPPALIHLIHEPWTKIIWKFCWMLRHGSALCRYLYVLTKENGWMDPVRFALHNFSHVFQRSTKARTHKNKVTFCIFSQVHYKYSARDKISEAWKIFKINFGLLWQLRLPTFHIEAFATAWPAEIKDVQWKKLWKSLLYWFVLGWGFALFKRWIWQTGLQYPLIIFWRRPATCAPPPCGKALGFTIEEHEGNWIFWH